MKDIGGILKLEFFNNFPADKIPLIQRKKTQKSDVAVVYLLWTHNYLAKSILISMISFLKNTDLLRADPYLLMQDTLDIREYEERFCRVGIDIIRVKPPLNRYFAVQNKKLANYKKIVAIDADTYAMNPCKLLNHIQSIKDPLVMSSSNESIETLFLKRKGLTLLGHLPDLKYLELLANLVNVPIRTFVNESKQRTDRRQGVLLCLDKELFTDPEWIDFSKRIYKLTQCNSDELNLTLYYYFVKKQSIKCWNEIADFPRIDINFKNLTPSSKIIHPFSGPNKNKKVIFPVIEKIINQILK